MRTSFRSSVSFVSALRLCQAVYMSVSAVSSSVSVWSQVSAFSSSHPFVPLPRHHELRSPHDGSRDVNLNCHRVEVSHRVVSRLLRPPPVRCPGLSLDTAGRYVVYLPRPTVIHEATKESDKSSQHVMVRNREKILLLVYFKSRASLPSRRLMRM